MKCDKCGCKNSSKLEHCSNCGNKLKKTKKSLLILIILMIVLFVVFFTVFLISILKTDSKQEPAEKQAPHVIEVSFASGDGIVCVDDKLVLAKNDGIYMREGINGEEKLVVEEPNVPSMLTDGKTIYYVEGEETDEKTYGKKDIYKIDAGGSETEVVCTSKGYAEIIAYENGCLYYLEIICENDYDYIYSLIKFDVKAGTSESLLGEWSGDIPLYWIEVACKIQTKIYVQKENSLYYYDIKTGESGVLIESESGGFGNVLADKASFIYTEGDSEYVAIVDGSDEVFKSVPIPQDLDVQIMDSDGEYVLCFNNGYTDPEAAYDLYRVDLRTGEVLISEGDAGAYQYKNYFVTYDLADPDKIYFMYNVGLYDEATNKIIRKNSEEFNIIITKPMWIYDGYIVDWEFNTYKIFDEATETPTTSEPALESEEDSEWKQIYIDYINSLDKSAYDDIGLIYVDDDEIPELYICGKTGVAAAKFCYILNGEVIAEPCGQTFGYVPYSGACYMFTQQMGVAMLTEYNLVAGELIKYEVASCSENTNSYIWEDEVVSKDEFWDNKEAYVNQFEAPILMSSEDAISAIESC